MLEVFFDCETYSELDLPTVGGLNYSRHPSTEILMWTFYCAGWESGIAITGVPDLEKALRVALKHQGSTWNIFAVLIHWGAFDRFMAQANAAPGSPFKLKPVIRDDLPQGLRFGSRRVLFDLRQHSLQCGGPAGLKNAAEWAGGGCKLVGKAGIKLFSSPDGSGTRTTRTDDPTVWKDFLLYGVRDAEVLSNIAQFLGPIGSPGLSQDGWRVVERMNMRGIPIDVASVRACRDLLAQLEPPLVEECQRLTGGRKVDGKMLGGLRPTQVQKIAEYLDLPNCQKLTLEEFVKDEDTPKDAKRIAEIRMEVGSSTRSKLAPMLTHLCEDQRVRYQFTYFGAWTRRLTAQAVQPQNFFRGKPEEEFFEGLGIIGRGGSAQYGKKIPTDYKGESVFEAVKKNIRGFIKAPPGRIFVAADFSQIELRVMAWLAEETWLLEALKDGVDVYRITGGEIYGKKPHEISDDERYISKRVELASQFGLSGTGIDGDGGLYSRLKSDGVKNFSRARSMDAIQIYRRTHPKIVKFWEKMGRALMSCVSDSETYQVGKITFEKTRDDLVRIIRPSGHFQCIWEPKIVLGMFDKPVVSYIGRDKTGAMRRTETYGPKIAQGATQGTAADLLHDGMRTAEIMGYPPIMSIHDEIVTEIDDDGEDHVEELCEIFTSQIPLWAEGIPIEAEGWQGRRFRK